jgi:hypothetical protein
MHVLNPDVGAIRFLPVRRIGDEKILCCDVYDGHLGRCGWLRRENHDDAGADDDAASRNSDSSGRAC